ncbi:hypothetical protein [Enterovirga aerilata]|uniref:Response regulatory domain-containing protein n=1 Tax=Enterovirga aerilata TaxID=2730920 RepID=A0A849I3X1_9HYPH|nr:hypothetical protein [Enterovirga sp. DB1703]NNM72058.1 hypothetical protein [Enterovirga sp. DB1703]
MNDLQKVLVVDNGERDEVDPLAAELAELGFSSVTTSFEAADDVLQVLPQPSAIFLKMPQKSGDASSREILALADRLRIAQGPAGAPVFVWDRARMLQSGGVSALLRGEFSAEALATA